MEERFVKAVEDGLKLSKRIYAGKERPSSAVAAPPRPVAAMDRSSTSSAGLKLHHHQSHLPTAPMMYAVIGDPAIVDNPDIPSYQPHVYGRCDAPALIPLQLNEIAMDVDCFMGSALVEVRGKWRVHCVMGSRSCNCRLVVPMGEQGSILGVEVEVGRKSYVTQLIKAEEKESIAKNEGGAFLKPQIFSLTVPQVDGGSIISIKVSWSQQLLYADGQFTISIPFSFPEYVAPFGKRFPKREKIQLNINTGLGKEVLCETTSHPLKERKRHVDKLCFSYEVDVDTWSIIDFLFSYKVYSSDIFGGVLLKSPSVLDTDQREMFYLYLFPGCNHNRNIFRKEVVFIVDISGSMLGKPLENAKNALSAALIELAPADSFCIIAFNEETFSFSSYLELATKEVVENAIQWMDKNFVAGGGTNITRPLNEAMNMLSNAHDSIPHIFLITDGAVEDERNICRTVKSLITSRASISPRISTFGIGSYCNHYFLRMLAAIGGGHYDAAYDVDSIETRMQRLCSRALSTVLANINVDVFDHVDEFEVYPFNFPDLSNRSPLVVSGRYRGHIPDSCKARGTLSDLTDFITELKVRRTEAIPLNKVLAMQHIDLLTSQAWFSESELLEEKVTKLSLQYGVPSEYTFMVLLRIDKEKNATEQAANKIDLQKYGDPKNGKITLIQALRIGFGDVAATIENLPAGYGEAKPPEAAAEVLIKVVSCCNRIADCCCCMCCIQICNQMNDKCVTTLTQLCTALSCFACIECCAAVCCSSD
ncbi:hypothetical protein QJS04_geneDACA004889 [Acorus gramineus]|uniref:VWFA domain-containing protein n=1 Tax=Acorus gramineus TaxID=55184 RepID=A0AAV9BZ34_ACOGR|nr:hypothetical protein QJS04_geneDACA004889 [Acorus gramineus]